MKRRQAIQSLALASVSTLFITSCADRPATDFLNDGTFAPNDNHSNYMVKISEAILPLGDVSERVPNSSEYIVRMINDTVDQVDRNAFVVGFEEYKKLMIELGSKLKKASAEEIVSTMTKHLEDELSSDNLILFINKMRELSIRNLYSSEYFLTEYREYQLVPDPYNPCLPYNHI